MALQLQQSLHATAQLQQENHELRVRLSRYEDVGPLDQENVPPGPLLLEGPSEAPVEVLGDAPSKPAAHRRRRRSKRADGEPTPPEPFIAQLDELEGVGKAN